MHFVIKRKPGTDDVLDLDRLIAEAGAEIVDRIGGQAALLEGSEAAMTRLSAALPGWSVSPETGLGRPVAPFPRPGWKLD